MGTDALTLAMLTLAIAVVALLTLWVGRLIGTVLKIGLALALLYFIFSHLDPKHLEPYRHTADRWIDQARAQLPSLWNR